MKKRVISAIVLLAILIPLIIIGGIPFRIGALIIGLLSLKELLDIRKSKKAFPFVMQFISYILLTILILSNNSSKLFFLGTAFNLIILTRNYSLVLLIYLVLITTITDTFAYITGSYIGKTKMCEKISPKKTWEGMVGGTFFGVFIPAMFYISVVDPNVDVILITAITTFLSLLAQAGDLVFSSIKRYYDKKDFSNLIPGHGGILDRLDSLIFVLLGFVVILEML